MTIMIHLRYFAVIREAFGREAEARAFPTGTTAGEACDAVFAERPALQGLRRSLLLMVNQEYVPADHVLTDGDELALIPPVSGGAHYHLRVTADPLDAREAEAAVADPSCGAIVTFTGTVRDAARGREVTALDYEAYAAAAEKMMATIAAEVTERWGIERVAILHRTGLLGPGEASVVIAVAAPHRAETFEAARHVIERLKEIVPIWKKEHYADGSSWIGSEAEYQRIRHEASDPHRA
jgi:molybdopterin synthase catalytic subunit